MRTEQVDEHAQKQSPLRQLISWQALITTTFLVIALVSLLFAYLALQEPKPGVIFETIGDTNVLDLRRPLQDLSIVFRGQNVQEQNLNLRIVTINVVNSGQIDILPSHYDHEDEWGMKFKDGEVIEARLVGTNSDYLWSKIVPQRLSVDTVAFPKVIFERGDYFAIEVLLLHPKNESPSISSVGKIAGITEITVLTRPLAKVETSLFTELFQGSALIQVLRVMIYFAGPLLVIVALIFAMAAIGSFSGKLRARRRRNRILQTRTMRQEGQDDIRNILVTLYESDGTAGLKGLQELIQTPGIVDGITPSDRRIVHDHYHISDRATAKSVFDHEFLSIGSLRAFSALMDTNRLKMGEDYDTVINQRFCEMVNRLLEELRS